MKIKRFFAADIRQAMKMVKEELGADAVIMSNKSVDGGVEIVAARDFDEQLIQNKLQKQTPEQQPPVRETKKRVELPDFETERNRLHVLSSPRKQGADGYTSERPVRSNRFPVDADTSTIPGGRRNIDQYVGYAEKVHLRGNPETVTAKTAKPFAPAVKDRPYYPTEKAPEKKDDLSDNLLMEMSKELKSLRAAMDSKLSSVSWAHNSKTNPVRAELLQRLAGMSISRKLSVKIADRFTNHTDSELVVTQAQELLTKVLPIADDDLLESGGIAALVGPTGVGKTTTIAKLAAKFILKYGSRQVALITTDNYRIGAHEQLNTYGRILDIPVRVASSAAELRNLINGFSDKRLILIDTAGMSQRDMKLTEQINTLRQTEMPIKSYLVMSAATEYKAMNEIIKAFQIFEPQAGILTKLDEAATIGSAISSIIEHNLPLSFITDGQQVPEDMHSPCARTLIAQCAAELEMENDYNNSANNEAWVAQGYA
jgi:flagellar biosynthesis protein FlhF